MLSRNTIQVLIRCLLSLVLAATQPLDAVWTDGKHGVGRLLDHVLMALPAVEAERSDEAEPHDGDDDSGPFATATNPVLADHSSEAGRGGPTGSEAPPRHAACASPSTGPPPLA